MLDLALAPGSVSTGVFDGKVVDLPTRADVVDWALRLPRGTVLIVEGPGCEMAVREIAGAARLVGTVSYRTQVEGIMLGRLPKE